jgi:excinuclease ABC subunit C
MLRRSSAFLHPIRPPLVPTTVDPPLKALRETVRAAALNRPGVYRMLAETGVVIYVGKSKRVRTRLLGYFRARSEEKAWRIIREAQAVEWEYVPSEFASLLRELELIKRYRPPYNVRQKRDGLYSFLKLSTGGAPKLNVVRRINDEPGTYFGPFRGGQRIVEAVRELNDVLQLRDCRAGVPIHYSDQADLFGSELTPLCVRYELRRCLAPCAGRCSETEYLRRIEQAHRFLGGDAHGPIDQLTGRMEDAAERLEFEHAARLRDRIGRLEDLRAEFLRLRAALGGLTFLYCVPGFDGDHRVYAIRSGSIRAVDSAPRTARQRRRLIDRLGVHLRQPESQRESTSRERVEQILLVAHWFRTRPDQLERTYPAERLRELPLTRQLDRLPVA